MNDLPREEVVAVVDWAVDELLAAAGVEGPPVDAIAIAQRHLGMVICIDRQQRQRGRAQRAAGEPHIYLRPEDREERHQWTVAHEIGEHRKADLLARLGVEPDRTPAMAGESLANLFAFRLLTPTPWFAADSRQLGHDLFALKDRYRTASHEVIALRWLDLTDPCVVAIVDNGRVTRRRSNAVRVNKQLSPAERRCQEEVSRSGEPRAVRLGGWSVQGWPVHQMAWQREVLRSVVDEADE